MKHKRNVMLITLFGLFSWQVSGNSYQFITNNNNITCVVDTMSDEKALNLIGDFGYFLEQYTEVKNLTIGTQTTSYPRLFNVFKNIVENYTFLKVTIENNTNNTIIIPQHNYLQNASVMLKPKEQLDKQVYAIFGWERSKLAVLEGACGIATLIGAGVSAVTIKNGLAKVLSSLGLLGITAGLGYLAADSYQKVVAANKKKEELFSSINNQEDIILKNDEYIICPGAKFQDLYLIKKDAENKLEVVNRILNYQISP
jgi:hypothetical protein